MSEAENVKGRIVENTVIEPGQPWGRNVKKGQRVRFIDQYRSYVINYNYGKDLVRRFIESRGGTAEHPVTRWKEFERLLSSPRLPSGLL